jgi:ABC-type histidine transport system ATPase subunit
MAELNSTTDKFERADVVLQVADLRAGYGRVPVLHGVNLQIHEG